MQRFGLFIMAFLAFATMARAEALTVPALGLIIEKPASWHEVAGSGPKPALLKSGLSDDELKKAVRAQTGTSLFDARKHETLNELNPRLTVAIQPAASERDFEYMIQLLSGGYKGKITEQGQQTIGNQPASYGKIAMPSQTTGSSAPEIMEVWTIYRNGYLLVIMANTREDEATGTRSEIRQIIDTIRIE